MSSEIEIRPGVFCTFRAGVKARLMRFACQTCGASDPAALDYMLRDSLWRALVIGDGVLCLACLERRLERPVKQSDFRPGFAPGLMRLRDAFIRQTREDCSHQNTDGAATSCQCHVTLAELIERDRAEALKNPEVYNAQLLEAEISPEPF